MTAVIRQVLIDGYPIDVAKVERHSFTSEVTTHPVEKGVDVADHVRRNPNVVTLECVVSDTPIGSIALHETRRVDEVTQAVFGDAVPRPSTDAYGRLKTLQATPKLITIETSLDRFDNMLLTELSVPCDSSTTGGLTFEATFVEIRVIANRRVAVPVAVPRARGKSRLGAKSGAEYRVDGRILWRVGRPFPGAPLEANHAWAVVEVTFGTETAFATDEEANQYHYSGEFSGANQSRRGLGERTSRPFPFLPVKAGQRLGPAEVHYFFQDLKRDQREKRAGHLSRLTSPSLASGGQSALTAREQAERQRRNLPAGLDLSRFQTGPDATFPAVGPNTTFAPGQVQ